MSCACRLLAAVVAALGAPHCSSASRDTALSVIEHLLSHQANSLTTATADVPAGGAMSDMISCDEDEEMLALQGGQSGTQGKPPHDGHAKKHGVNLEAGPALERAVEPALERHRVELLAALRAVVMTAMGVAPSVNRVCYTKP